MRVRFGQIVRFGLLAVLVAFLALRVACALEGVRFVRAESGVRGFEWIREIRAGDAGFTAMVSGRLPSERIATFVELNRLVPLEENDDDPLFGMSSAHGMRKWERNWPKDPEWLESRHPRPLGVCRLGCDVLCLLDRKTGRVWIAVETPDLAGD
jgi:hypothetical protein